MDFSFTPEQQQLRDSLRSFLADRYRFEQRRAISNSEQGWDKSIWKALADELGVLGMALPEKAGGFGLGPVDTMVVMEELGRALVVEPYLETVVLVGGLLSGLPGEKSGGIVAQIAAGELIATFAWAEADSRYNARKIVTSARPVAGGWCLDGAKSVVTAAPWADGFLVTARTSADVASPEGISLFWVDAHAEGVALSAYPTVDGRRAADIYFDGVVLGEDALMGEVDGAWPRIEKAMDTAIAGLCAEGIGVMSRLLSDTLDYTKQRKQFGQAISEFQVLQHRMVDMYMELEMAISATYLATLKLGDDPVERARAVSSAKVTVGNACRMIGQNAVQLHGGMGMTDELAVSHYFKRATAIEGEFGSVDYHLARYGRLAAC